MQYTVALLAALASVAVAAPQGVTAILAPSGTAPANCKPTYTGSFNIEVVNAATVTKRDVMVKRADALTVTLANGILLDNQGRTGYIADNYQFQFDKPAQTGALYTAGWSACTNGSLALGGSNIFYQCLSGDFYNLYDRHWAPQCLPILIQIIPVASNTSTSAGVSQISDGQVAATSASSIRSMSGSVVSQITDGQVQATTAASLRSSSSATAVVSQITDGQIQATSAASFVSTRTTTGVTMFTGAANALSYAKEIVAVAAGAAAVALL